MKFDELDREMRVYETAHDICVLPGLFMVARIDGRNFTRLTKETHVFEAPFDERMRNLMVQTTAHLMECGFRAVYGYTQSDEISILFHQDIHTFGRKLRKYHSILAGEASAKFSLLLGSHAAFDCRISELPSAKRVGDYFRWRAEDAHRNALNAHCYWLLRKEGQAADTATASLLKLTTAAKNELLWQRGINFNELPAWQKRGVGLYWEDIEKTGVNPLTGVGSPTIRRRLKVEVELPIKERYGEFMANLVETAQSRVARADAPSPSAPS